MGILKNDFLSRPAATKVVGHNHGNSNPRMPRKARWLMGGTDDVGVLNIGWHTVTIEDGQSHGKSC